MNGRDGLTERSSGRVELPISTSAHRDLHAVLQLVESIDRDHVAGLYPSTAVTLPSSCRRNSLHRDCLIRLHDVHKRILCVALNRDVGTRITPCCVVTSKRAFTN
jgi:hypothetical protein